MNTETFQALVRDNLKGWYSRKEYEDNAVDRITTIRAEFRAILSGVNRDGLTEVLDYLDECGFYYRPSSADRHHNYPGGLAEHCLGVYRKMQIYGLDDPFHESVKIVGLFHDLCKCDMFYFNGRQILSHKRHGHGSRSVRILGRYGVRLSREEYRAIRYHMGRPHNPKRQKDPEFVKAIKEPLRKAVSWADREDSADACARARRKWLILLNR